MVSEKPMDGRCGRMVIDKVGLEVHDEVADASYSTLDNDAGDGRLESVDLVQDDVTVTEPAEYQDVLQYLRNGFSLSHVNLSDPDGSDGDEETVQVEDDDPYVTNADKNVKGYCERYPVKSEDKESCPVHPEPGGGAPEDNLNAMTHGLHAKRSSFYKNLDREDKIVVEQFVDGWLDLSSYDRDDTPVLNELYRIAVDQIRLWNAQDEFEKGVVYDQMAEYDIEDGKIYAEQENPANLPYDRLDRTTFKKLKDLGVLDDPESQKADAIEESLADKFSDLEDD